MSQRYFQKLDANGNAVGSPNCWDVGDEAFMPLDASGTVLAGWKEITGSWPLPLTLQDLQNKQILLLKQQYQTAISAPVSFTNAAGVTATYAFGSALTPGGRNAELVLSEVIAAGSANWKADVWVDTNGVAQTMTFADLQGLQAAVEAAETPDEQKLMTLIAQVQAVTTKDPANPSATAIKTIQAVTF